MTEDEAKAKIANSVSRETWERLQAYHRLLLKWQPAINLVSPATTGHVWSRHLLDSLQLLEALDDRPASWADLGSGAGFPGLVCAIALDVGPTPIRFDLVEADIRKCTFLRQVAQETRTDLRVHTERAERLAPLAADVVSARALAPLPRLLPLVHRHLAPTGTALLPKGARHAEELELARQYWQMDVDIHPSATAADAVILRIRNLTHA
jgi:16S rRNA (guanine527-N7)-methyltransferase